MIVLHTKMRRVAMSVGPIIVVGRYFAQLTKAEQQAVLAHEACHISRFHSARRILRLVTLRWAGLMDYCKTQELEADMYAARLGHAHGLLRFFGRFKPETSPLHPDHEQRIAILRAWLHENPQPAT